MRGFVLCLFLAATSSFANPLHLGFEARFGAEFPTLGYGFARPDVGAIHSLGPTLDVDLGDRWALRGSAAWAYQTWGYDWGGNNHVDVSQQNLEIGIAPVFKITPRFWTKAGYSLALPLWGKSNTVFHDAMVDSSRIDLASRMDWRWAGDAPTANSARNDILATHSLELGAGYQIDEHLELTVDAICGLTGLFPKHGSDGEYDGALSNGHNITLNRICLGARTAF